MTGGPLEERHIPADVLGGMLAYLRGSRFSGSTQRLHTTLARMRPYFPVLKVFVFAQGGAFPYSRQLEDALSVLQRARLNGMENPDFDTYFLSGEAKRYLERKVLPRFSADEQQQLADIAEVFEIECPVPI